MRRRPYFLICVLILGYAFFYVPIASMMLVVPGWIATAAQLPSEVIARTQEKYLFALKNLLGS